MKEGKCIICGSLIYEYGCIEKEICINCIEEKNKDYFKLNKENIRDYYRNEFEKEINK